MRINTDGPNLRRRTIFIAVGLLLVIAVLSLGGVAIVLDRAEDDGMALVIPEGSAATLDEPTIDSAIDVPTDLVLEQGQVLTIRNEDEVANRAGPWVLAAGETLRMRFDTPGEYFYLCTVDASESVTVTVVEVLEGTPGQRWGKIREMSVIPRDWDTGGDRPNWWNWQTRQP